MDSQHDTPTAQGPENYHTRGHCAPPRGALTRHIHLGARGRVEVAIDEHRGELELAHIGTDGIGCRLRLPAEVLVPLGTALEQLSQAHALRVLSQRSAA